MLKLSDFKASNISVLHEAKVNTLDINGSSQQKNTKYI